MVTVSAILGFAVGVGLSCAGGFYLLVRFLRERRPAPEGFFLARVLKRRWEQGRRWFFERRRRRDWRGALPALLSLWVQNLRAGRTFLQGLEAAAREGPKAVREILERLVREIQLGADPLQAMEAFQREYEFFAWPKILSAYRLSRRTGCSLAALLERLRRDLEQKQRLEDRKNALTAQARLSVKVMALLPFFLAVFLTVMDPAYLTPLFSTPTGWAVLGLAVLLQTGGFFWVKRLMEDAQ